MANKRQLKKAMASCVSEAMLEAYLQLNFNKEFSAEKCSEVIDKTNCLYIEAVKAINNCKRRYWLELAKNSASEAGTFQAYTRKTYTDLITQFNDGVHEIETLLGRKAE